MVWGGLGWFRVLDGRIKVEWFRGVGGGLEWLTMVEGG